MEAICREIEHIRGERLGYQEVKDGESIERTNTEVFIPRGNGWGESFSKGEIILYYIYINDDYEFDIWPVFKKILGRKKITKKFMELVKITMDDVIRVTPYKNSFIPCEEDLKEWALRVKERS